MSNKSPVWPGPCLMVPIPTDVLLIGDLDVVADTPWAELKNNYYGQWQFGVSAQPAPFNPGTCPDVGAHLMWSLPDSLRRGNQQQTAGAPVDFPLAPNRWVITRFGYGTDGSQVSLVSTVVQSDLLVNAGGNINNVNQYPQYDSNPAIQEIGKKIPLASWTGEQSANPTLLKAIGPGDVTWAVAYDNIRNVFSLHDDLPDEQGIYTYSIIGWYSDPTKDPTHSLPTGDGVDPAQDIKNWKSMLESQFQWMSEDVNQAISDWLAWQQAHGLKGTWDPGSLNLPPQALEAIKAWYAWQQANGSTETPSDLPVQSLSHSMVATVQWRGSTNQAYGQGIPLGEGGKPKLPEIVISDTAEGAISTYMATKASKVPGSGITPEDVNNLSRVLVAFQKDLLFDLQTNTEYAESLIHDSYFDKKYAGQEWIVVLADDAQDFIHGKENRGGQQAIPLNLNDSITLINLNKDQATTDNLLHTIDTQRKELYALAMKLEFLTLNRGNPKDLKIKVNDSIKALGTALRKNITDYAAQLEAIKNASEVFQEDLGNEYIVKAVDLTPIASPVDPVVLFSGGDLDTKLLPRDVDGVAQKLPIRFTGQTITSMELTFAAVQPTPVTISVADLLGTVEVPAWNAIPKEALDLWVEVLFLDTSNANQIANIYFTKTNHAPIGSEHADLILQIQTQQTALYNKFENQPPTEALTQACGFGGLMSDDVGIAYRPNKQPWTPIYMDWKVKWFPVPGSPEDALQNWKLGDLDYIWEGNKITAPIPEIFYQGRSVLNIKNTRNIQQKFTTFQNDPNYQNLSDNTIKNLEWVANNVQYLDLVTQSMSGFNEQLINMIPTMKNEPTDADIKELLDGSSYFNPLTGSTGDKNAGPFYPVRSGHFQVIDLWLVDSFGQVLKGKSNLFDPSAPIDDIIWSETMTTKSPNFIGETKTFGQLQPRFCQNAKFTPRFLQSNDDNIISNSADRTSPICGWVMANHLDNALMVFDSMGTSLGSVIKVQRETTGNEQIYSIRWDAVPGSNTALGAAPVLGNDHLQAFINALLVTGTAGSQAYDDLMTSIDSSLWSSSNFNQTGNLAILLGRPIAVVRGEVELNLSGMPAYNQSWFQTGEYYNNNGTYDPTSPPFVNTKFNVRIGDSLMNNNGVFGYFEADRYDTFYSVYGINGQTDATRKLFSKKGGQATMSEVSTAIKKGGGLNSGYVKTNHLVQLSANQGPVKLTLFIDPGAGMPIIPGSLPGSMLALPNGPVQQALDNLRATFRTGPLLLNPNKIQMPTPAEVNGNWSWIARKDVTEWNNEAPIKEQTSSNTFNTSPLNLIEGWLTLANISQDSNE